MKKDKKRLKVDLKRKIKKKKRNYCITPPEVGTGDKIFTLQKEVKNVLIYQKSTLSL